jgi:hypothetical protein
MVRCLYTHGPSAPIPIESNPPEHPASQPGTFEQRDLTKCGGQAEVNNVEA